MSDNERKAREAARTLTVRVAVPWQLGDLSELDLATLKLYVRRGAEQGLVDGASQVEYERMWKGNLDSPIVCEVNTGDVSNECHCDPSMPMYCHSTKCVGGTG